MDGIVLNKAQVALKAWVAQATHATQAQNIPPVHLNQWLEAKMASLDMIELSCRLYEMLIDETKHLEYELMPHLRIPLTLSDTLNTIIPSFNDLDQDHISQESPSFCLPRRDFCRYLIPIERYDFPVKYNLFQRYTSNIYVYYNIARSQHDINENWEFSRNIIAEYYPDTLIL